MIRKRLILPSGKDVYLQGYEPQALKGLLSGDSWKGISSLTVKSTQPFGISISENADVTFLISTFQE